MNDSSTITAAAAPRLARTRADLSEFLRLRLNA